MMAGDHKVLVWDTKLCSRGVQIPVFEDWNPAQFGDFLVLTHPPKAW